MNRIDLSNMTSFMGRVSNDPNALYLKFAQSNEWLLGRDADTVSGSDRFLIDIREITHGWSGWENGRKLGPLLVPLLTDSPMPECELKHVPRNDQGDGWKKALGVTLHSVDNNSPIFYTADTIGGRTAVTDLVNKIATNSNALDMQQNPIVTLSSTSYVNKKSTSGVTYNPAFIIVDWVSI